MAHLKRKLKAPGWKSFANDCLLWGGSQYKGRATEELEKTPYIFEAVFFKLYQK